jgi:hypothetical protein
MAVGPTGTTTLAVGPTGADPSIYLSTPVWDDMQILQGIKLTGNTAVYANFETINGITVQQLSFGRNSNNYIDFAAQTPHTWQTDSQIVPHMHWCADSNMVGLTGGFRISWEIRPRNGIYTGVIGSGNPVYQDSVIIGPATNANQHYISNFQPRIPTGMAPSSIIVGHLDRIDTNGPTSTSYFFLIGFDMHILKDKIEGNTGPYA